MSVDFMLIRKGLKFLFYRLIGKPFPFTVVLVLTAKCNFACGYCRSYKRAIEDIQTDKLIEIINEISRKGAWRILFSGGEPLLRPDIGIILKSAKDAGLKVGLISNGRLIPDKIKLLKYVDYVSLSIDGTEEITDSNRMSGAFKSVINAAEVLKVQNVRMKLNAVLTHSSANSENIHFILNLARKYGASCSFNLTQLNTELFGDTSEYLASPDKYHDALDELISKFEPTVFTDFKKSFKIVRDWPDYRVPRILGEKKAKQSLKYYPKCWAGKYTFYIDADGNLYPCCLLVGEFDAKNIFSNGGLTQAWRHAMVHQCAACMSIELNTANIAFSLNPILFLSFLKGNFFTKI